jgi:hypothetical protein
MAVPNEEKLIGDKFNLEALIVNQPPGGIGREFQNVF